MDQTNKIRQYEDLKLNIHTHINRFICYSTDIGSNQTIILIRTITSTMSIPADT